jgi:hypothetical protein
MIGRTEVSVCAQRSRSGDRTRCRLLVPAHMIHVMLSFFFGKFGNTLQTHAKLRTGLRYVIGDDNYDNR